MSENKKKKNKEEEKQPNTNSQIELDESDNEEVSNEDKDEDDEEKKTIHLCIYIKLITQLIKKINGEYPCICHNLDEKDCITKNNKNLLNNKELLSKNEDFQNITKKNDEININNQINDQNLISNNINFNITNNNNSNNNNNNNCPFLEEEIVPDVEVPITQDGKILMKNIINKLKYFGYPVVGSLFSIYINSAEDYVYIGSDPIDPNFYIDETLVNFENLKIKIVSYIEDKLVKKTEKQLFDKNEMNKNSKDKRPKERKIEFIVEKVNAWRRLYNGFYNENGEYTRYSLDQAAKMVGISKKSLDDYLLQLRLGRKYGFNFNQNKTKKVGILRAFVKRHRAMLQGGQQSNEEENNENEGQQASNDSDDSDD